MRGAIILAVLALAGCGMDKYDKRNAFRQCIQADGNRPPVECAEAVERIYGEHRDRDGHRMAETVSGSVHDQPGPQGIARYEPSTTQR